MVDDSQLGPSETPWSGWSTVVLGPQEGLVGDTRPSRLVTNPLAGASEWPGGIGGPEGPLGAVRSFYQGPAGALTTGLISSVPGPSRSSRALFDTASNGVFGIPW